MLTRTVAELGAAAREKRKSLNMTQAELARRLGVKRDWVVRFEQGSPGAALGKVLDALALLDLTLDLQAAPPRRQSHLDVMTRRQLRALSNPDATS